MAQSENRISNLPAASPAFIGRQQEVQAIMGMLQNSGCRMVTITGIGGIGKTSLALAVGDYVGRKKPDLFPDGITFVALQAVEAGSSYSDALATATAEALQLQLSGREAPAIEVMSHLEKDDRLLIFDNFEHLLGGGGWLVALLRRCPQIKLLVTSRELLNLPGEQRFALGGLPYPALETEQTANMAAEEYEAVQLFLQTAQEARPSFTLNEENKSLVIECTQLVMGMPLALKLAAYWLRSLSLETLVWDIKRNLDRLSTQMVDIPGRQRSMRAIFEATWVQMDGHERAVLAELSVFRGGFAAEAAETLAGADRFDLANLHDRGLLQEEQQEARFVLHELVRQYAMEKLAGSEEKRAAAEMAHSRYYAWFLGERIPRLLSPDLPEAISAIEKDIANIRAGLRWALTHEHEQTLADLALYGRALRFYYLRRGLYHEGLETFRQLTRFANPHLETGSAPEVKALLGPVAMWEGLFDYVLGDLDNAAESYRRSLDLLGDQDPTQPFAAKDRSDATHMSGQVEHSLGHYQEALRLFGEAEKLELDQGNVGYAAKSTAFMGIVYKDLGDYESAESYLESAVPKLKENRDYFYGATALGSLAQVRHNLGKADAGIVPQLWENLAGSRDFRSPFAEANTLLYLGVAIGLADARELDEARSLVGSSLRIFEKISAPIGRSRAQFWLAKLTLWSGQILIARNMFLSGLKMSAEYALAPLVIENMIGLVLANQRLSSPFLGPALAGRILATAKVHPAATASTGAIINELEGEGVTAANPESPASLEQLVLEMRTLSL